MAHRIEGRKLHKFGGTSLSDARLFRRIATLAGPNDVIVVSAVKGVTSKLQVLLDEAVGKNNVDLLLNELYHLHRQIIESLLLPSHQIECLEQIGRDLRVIANVLETISVTGRFDRLLGDYVLGFGELWSAKILVSYLCSFKKILMVDASKVLFVSHERGSMVIHWAKSKAALDVYLEASDAEQLVITGFIAKTDTGHRTTLGRNGSDFSAAVFAHLLGLEEIYIWTDVDGVYTADPRRVKAAFVLKSISYHEALELAYFGSKVLHPRTIGPAMEAKIPIYIKNTFAPEKEGTKVSEDEQASRYLIKGLSSIDEVALFNVEGCGMVGVSGMASRVFSILRDAHISVILISQASSEHSICFAVPKLCSELAYKTLEEHLQFELSTRIIEGIHVDNDVAIVALVGDGLVTRAGVLGRLGAVLVENNIQIYAMALGSSRRNLSIVIARKWLDRALNAIHTGFYLSPKTLHAALLGVGHVGSALLNQLGHQFGGKKIKGWSICLHGVIASKKMLIREEGIALCDVKSHLATGEEANLKRFITQLSAMNLDHLVIIDCTASRDVVAHYPTFFAKGMHVVTPNKLPGTLFYPDYQKMMALIRRKNRKFFYEGSVCAGLPVISTLQELIATGDEIYEIEGVFSGTLSFVLGEVSRGTKLSHAIRKAFDLGYTESHPGEDLSGRDVARKLLILARELGHAKNLDDIETTPFFDPQWLDMPLERFWQEAPKMDEKAAKAAREAIKKGGKLLYTGRITKAGEMKMGVVFIDKDHPFARLEGTDNMVIFHTRRYLQKPLIVQGPGAGGEVTAAGVFGDLLRLLAYLSK